MANNAVNVDTEHIFAPKRRGFFADFFIRLFKEKPLGAVGFVICLIFLLTAFFADFIAPFGYNEMNPVDRLLQPSGKYLFGTDNIGRDLYSRIVYGARLSVIVGFAATLLSVVISILIGVTTGFFGGKFDLVVQRFVDGWMCFPGLVILIVAVSITGPGVIPAIRCYVYVLVRISCCCARSRRRRPKPASAARPRRNRRAIPRSSGGRRRTS